MSMSRFPALGEEGLSKRPRRRAVFNDIEICLSHWVSQGFSVQFNVDS